MLARCLARDGMGSSEELYHWTRIVPSSDLLSIVGSVQKFLCISDDERSWASWPIDRVAESSGCSVGATSRHRAINSAQAFRLTSLDARRQNTWALRPSIHASSPLHCGKTLPSYRRASKSRCWDLRLQQSPGNLGDEDVRSAM
jgi:hypothetical protein